MPIVVTVMDDKTGRKFQIEDADVKRVGDALCGEVGIPRPANDVEAISSALAVSFRNASARVRFSAEVISSQVALDIVRVNIKTEEDAKISVTDLVTP